MTTTRTSAALALLACALLGRAADAQIIGVTTLERPDLPTVSAQFGRALALDGSRLVVGVNRLDVQGQSGLAADAGGAFVYERSNGGPWTRVAEVVHAVPLAGAELGSTASVQGDVLALGAPLDDTVGTNRGSVTIFERQGDGTWIETQRIHPPTIGASELFGGVSFDGERLLITAANPNRIFVYEKGNGTTWMPMAVITPSVPANSWTFASHGDRIAVGNPTNAVVQLFERAGPDWNLVGTLAPTSSVQNTSFGQSIAFSADGTRMYVGAPKLGVTGGIVVFELQPNLSWAQTGVITTVVPEGGLGAQVTIAGERIVASVVANQGFPVGVRRSIVLERSNTGTWSPVMEIHHTDFSTTTIRAASSEQFFLGLSSLGTDGAFGIVELGSLRANGRFVDTSSGGSQLMYLRAGPAVANDLFVLLGSLNTVSNGLPLGGGLTIPLAFDAYMSMVLGGSSPLQYWFGPLDGNGNANSSFVAPPLAYAALSGLVLHHAFFTLDPTTFAVDHVSNVVSLELVP
jgi:hypothetical protein